MSSGLGRKGSHRQREEPSFGKGQDTAPSTPTDVHERSWVCPPELDQPLPRGVRMSKTVKTIMMFFAISSLTLLSYVTYISFPRGPAFADFVPLLLVFVIMGGGFGFIFIGSLWGYRKEKRLLMWGVATPVLTFEFDDEIGGQIRQVLITYRFRDQAGSIVKAVHKITVEKCGCSVDQYLADKFQASVPTVLFDPRKSSRCRLYPLSTAILDMQ